MTMTMTMRSRWLGLLWIALVIPLSGSTCVIKSGNKSKGDGGTRIVVCNPPSAACSAQGGATLNTRTNPTTSVAQVRGSEISSHPATRSEAVVLQAALTSGVIPITSQSLSPSYNSPTSSIPEPGSALLFGVGALMIFRGLSPGAGS